MQKYSSHLFIGLMLLALMINSCGKKDSTGTITPPVVVPKVFYPWTTFAMGADLSYVNQVQDYGGVYKDSGVVKDPFTIFQTHGANVVRVRLWNNPQWLAPLNG